MRRKQVKMALLCGAMIVALLAVPGFAWAGMPTLSAGQPYDGVNFAALMNGNNGIYYGAHDHVRNLLSMTVLYDGFQAPILWRPMGEERNSGVGDGRITLFSQYILGQSTFNPVTSMGNVYENSQLYDWHTNFVAGSFSAGERSTSAMAPVAIKTSLYDLGTAPPATILNSWTTAVPQQAYPLWGFWETSSYSESLLWSADGTISSNAAENIYHALYWQELIFRAPIAAGYLRSAPTVEQAWWIRSPSSRGVGAYLPNETALLYTDQWGGTLIQSAVDAVYAGTRPAFKLVPSSVLYATEILPGGSTTAPGQMVEDGVNYFAAGGGATSYKLTIQNNALALTSLEESATGASIATHGTVSIREGSDAYLTGTLGAGTTHLTYKIVEGSAGRPIIRYGEGVGGSITLDTAGLALGNYDVYVWAQADHSLNSHEGSPPIYFNLSVEKLLDPTTMPPPKTGDFFPFEWLLGGIFILMALAAAGLYRQLRIRSRETRG